MKKVMTKLVSLLLAAVCCFSVSACNNPDSGKTLLKVSVFAAGFGRAWLDEIAAEYMKQNPDVVVKVAASTGMEATAQGALESGRTKSLSDIYSCTNSGNFLTNVNADRLLKLDDIYETVVDGEKLIDKLDKNAVEKMQVNGHYYAIPWNASVTSIAYNDKMFAANGWDVPTTMDEFYTLCNRITKETSSYAIGYVGGAGCDGYLKSVFSAFSFQYDGDEGRKEFYEFESSDVYKMEGRKKAYEAIGKIITGVGTDSNGASKPWVYPGSNNVDNETIQKKFFQGEVAMLVNGSWLMTEMKDYIPLYPNFSCKMMNLPWISADKTSKDGGTTNINVSECTLLVIPKNCANPELAKDFLNFMNSDAMLRVYTKNTNNVRPFKYQDVDMGELDGWTQSILDVYKNSINVYGTSNNLDYRLGRIKSIMIENIIPRFAGKSANDLDSIINDIITFEAEYAKEFIGK